MYTYLIWALAIIFIVPAVVIAILAIAVCLTYKKLDEEREQKSNENVDKERADG